MFERENKWNYSCHDKRGDKKRIRRDRERRWMCLGWMVLLRELVL